ncbi:MAG TPA: hypothetical protein VH063_00780 [Gaiellaceae bacterium]|jgi:hypothetical protein|nr:hypothetical protein [Gaiellaceae bacterium]
MNVFPLIGSVRVERRDGADVRPRRSVPDHPSELAQVGAIGCDNEVDRLRE